MCNTWHLEPTLRSAVGVRVHLGAAGQLEKGHSYVLGCHILFTVTHIYKLASGLLYKQKVTLCCNSYAVKFVVTKSTKHLGMNSI